MIESTGRMLEDARQGCYAVAAFNIYNLEGARAVILAAEAEHAPVLLQIHPAALRFGGLPLVVLSTTAAKEASIPVSVHLDHSSSESDIQTALQSGITSVMADGSHLNFDDNVAFTSSICELIHPRGGFVEAELGRLSGTEDNYTVDELQAKFTEPKEAQRFVKATGIDALAVCIGNIHGHYRKKPQLDFGRLEAIRASIDIPLVLHGASGLTSDVIQRCLDLGVVKFNVNTELRDAYTKTLRRLGVMPTGPDLVDLMKEVVTEMQHVATIKIRLLRASGKAFSQQHRSGS